MVCDGSWWSNVKVMVKVIVMVKVEPITKDSNVIEPMVIELGEDH